MTAPQAELEQAGREYLARLSDADLGALVDADAVTADRATARIEALHRQPALLLDALDRPATSAAVLNLAWATESGAVHEQTRAADRFAMISPFLLFAAAVHRTAADLAGASYAPERTAPRQRIPLFDGGRLSAYLASPRHRLFLADLLTSFARISGGVVLAPDGRHRRRWNDADPHRLAVLLDALPPAERPPVWKRLGDLALFLAGVFPDAAERLVPDEAAASQPAGAPDLAKRRVRHRRASARWRSAGPDRVARHPVVPAGGPARDRRRGAGPAGACRALLAGPAGPEHSGRPVPAALLGRLVYCAGMSGRSELADVARVCRLPVRHTRPSFGSTIAVALAISGIP